MINFVVHSILFILIYYKIIISNKQKHIYIK